jgi:hypothetical protein
MNSNIDYLSATRTQEDNRIVSKSTSSRSSKSPDKRKSVDISKPFERQFKEQNRTTKAGKDLSDYIYISMNSDKK